MKYLDYGGLSYLWSKLKAYFVSKKDFIENEEVVAAALTDLNERKLDAADLPSWASNDIKPTYTLDEVTDGNTRKLSDYLNKEDNTIPNIVPLYVKEYDYTCAASSTAEGFIFFGNVVPTSEDVGENWYIKFKLYVNLTSTSSTYSPNNKYCKGMYDCYVGASGTSNIYHYFNRSYSTSYRPIYHHLITNYATTTENGTSVGWTTKYANRATNPIKVGVRIQSAYGDTQPRHYKIEVYEVHNCTFSFPDNIEKYGSVYTTAKYGNCAAISADAGLLESGDANDTSTVYLTYTTMKTGAAGIKLYSLFMQDKDGTWLSFFTNAGGIGTSKTVNTAQFRLGSRIYRTSRSTDLSANSYFGTSQIYAYGILTDFRYSFPNITANSLGNGLTFGKPLYVLGSLDSEGYFRLDTTKCWAQDEPTTEDGKIYIRVCEAVYSDYNQSSMPTGNYRGDLISDGYAYWYKDGLFLRYYPGVPTFVLNQLDKYKLEKDYSKEYLTTIALEDGTISFNIWKNMGTDMITSISYSTDDGKTWITTNNTNGKSEHLTIDVNVNEGDKVLWKGDAQQTGYHDEDDYGDNVGSFFSSNCEFDIQGNVMSLLYGDDFNGEDTLEYDGQFACLFCDYDGENECKVVNARNLSLPATTLANNCYVYTFYRCTNLTTAPQLPATTLAEYCYYQMFRGCTSLTIAPQLPATTLAQYCYYEIFRGCTSLTVAPQLPATTLAADCYSHMFYGCRGLNYIKAMFTTTPSTSYTNSWVKNVSATGTFIKNSAATWNVTGDNGVPSGWTVVNESDYELVHKYELDAKAPLVIEVSDTDTTVPSGTYANIAAAIAEGREVIVKELLDDTEGSYFNYYMAEEQVADPNDNMSYVFICPVEGHKQNVIYISQNSTFFKVYINLAFENHTHGYLKLNGALQITDVTIANGDKLVVTDSSNENKIVRASVAFDGSTTTKALSQKGTWETFLKSHQDISGKANLASPAFTGTPTAPTAVTKTSTTQLATTAFVLLEIDRGSRIIPLLDNGSTTAGTWLATTNEITLLVDGLIFLYRIAIAGGSSTTTLNITANNVELGAITIYTNGTSKLTTHYKVGVYLILAYNSTDTCFRVVNFYDSNSTIVYGYYDLYFRPYVAETLYRYKLVALGADNRLHPIVVTNQTNATQVAKTPTSAGLRPYKIWYYNSTTTVNPGTAVTALVLITTYQSTSAAYTFNTSLTAYNLVYLRGTYDSLTDLFYLYIDDSSPCTSYYTLVPTDIANISLASYLTAGYYYWLVGGTYSTTNYYLLFDENPLYYFNGTNLIPASVALNSKWYGTEDEFDALTNLDNNTDYYIYDE